MKSGEIVARHFATREPVRVVWRDGVIASIQSTADSPEDRWVAPGLIDLQVNGFAGVDFQQDDFADGALLRAADALDVAGCGRFLLTLITDDWPRMLARVRHLRRLRAASAELQSAIVGWHIEGPFLSPEPGFCGAHDPRCMRDPRGDDIRELRDATGDDAVLFTIAPERQGALDAIRLAASLGIHVSLGHTNAPAEILELAIDAGASAFTHLANGCPRELDRHDNILWRVFDLARGRGSDGRRFCVSLIPDGIHVSPPLFRLAHRELGDSIFYVSDAMAAAGAPPGRHLLGRLELEVGGDRIVRFPGGTNFAGSALSPIEGVFRAARMLECPWQEAWKHYSEIPARLLGLPCELAAGAAADFCVVSPDTESSRDPVAGQPR